MYGSLYLERQRNRPRIAQECDSKFIAVQSRGIPLLSIISTVLVTHFVLLKVIDMLFIDILEIDCQDKLNV